MFEANLKKKHAFWRSQHESGLRLTKNEPMVLVNKDLTKRGFQKCSPELEIEKYICYSKRESECSLQIYI